MFSMGKKKEKKRSIGEGREGEEPGIHVRVTLSAQGLWL